MVAVAALLVGVGIGAASGSSTKKAAAKPGPTVTATATATVAGPTPAAITETLKPTVIKTIATRIRTATITYHPKPRNVINDDVYKVGPDIPSGTYRTKGGSDCYYAILNSTSSSDIADNGDSTGPQIIDVNQGKYLELSGGFTWSRE